MPFEVNLDVIMGRFTS